MATHNHPKITGTWTGDGTSHTLEVAKTEDPNMQALRNSHDPDEVIFATTKQARNFGLDPSRIRGQQ